MGCPLETDTPTTEQLLLMYRHIKGVLPLLEAMLIQRGALNPMRRYESQPMTQFTGTAKVSA